jgi:hypothetical protein
MILIGVHAGKVKIERLTVRTRLRRVRPWPTPPRGHVAHVHDQKQHLAGLGTMGYSPSSLGLSKDVPVQRDSA